MCNGSGRRGFSPLSDKCSKYILGKCLGVNADIVEMMGKLSGWYWYCEACNENQSAKVELTRQTEKLRKFVTHIETLLTEFPPLESSNKGGNIKKKRIPNDESKCQVKISGLPEISDPKSIISDLRDRTQINETNEKLDSTAVIKDSG